MRRMRLLLFLMLKISSVHSVYSEFHRIDSDVAHYSFNMLQPVLIIFGRNVAKRVSCHTAMS